LFIEFNFNLLFDIMPILGYNIQVSFYESKI